MTKYLFQYRFSVATVNNLSKKLRQKTTLYNQCKEIEVIKSKYNQFITYHRPLVYQDNLKMSNQKSQAKKILKQQAT